MVDVVEGVLEDVLVDVLEDGLADVLEVGLGLAEDAFFLHFFFFTNFQSESWSSDSDPDGISGKEEKETRLAIRLFLDQACKESKMIKNTKMGIQQQQLVSRNKCKNRKVQQVKQHYKG